jgi:hypothetical protein
MATQTARKTNENLPPAASGTSSVSSVPYSTTPPSPQHHISAGIPPIQPIRYQGVSTAPIHPAPSAANPSIPTLNIPYYTPTVNTNTSESYYRQALYAPPPSSQAPRSYYRERVYKY